MHSQEATQDFLFNPSLPSPPARRDEKAWNAGSGCGVSCLVLSRLVSSCRYDAARTASVPVPTDQYDIAEYCTVKRLDVMWWCARDVGGQYGTSTVVAWMPETKKKNVS